MFRQFDLISQLQGHFQDRRVIVPHFLQARLYHRKQHQVIMGLEKERIELKVIPLQFLCQLMLTIERGNPLCSDILEWLQEFKEILVDERVPEHRDSHASSSNQISLEPTSKRSEDLVYAQCLHSFP